MAAASESRAATGAEQAGRLEEAAQGPRQQGHAHASDTAWPGKGARSQQLRCQGRTSMPESMACRGWALAHQIGAQHAESELEGARLGQ